MKILSLLALMLGCSVAAVAQTTAVRSLALLPDTTIWGVLGSRTETRNDAGLQGRDGAMSGFFQTLYPVNYPEGAQSWWHLLDVRHAEPSNNFAMQFAGSFFDQNLYFRKTINNPATPWSKVVMEQNGQITFKGTYNFERFNIGKDGNNGGSVLEFVNHATDSLSYGVKMGANVDRFGYGLYFQGSSLSYYYDSLKYASKPALFVSALDNTIGIGTHQTAGYQLAVAGSMIAERIKVKAKGAWPDYVFEKDYPLPSLKSTAAFIAQHKHLPEIPSAKEVNSEGLDLGDMNARLLKKVEELTLHLIRQQEEIEKLQQQNHEILQQIRKMSNGKSKAVN
ncbi:hypothetical protein [Chitinophaga qingshengii]|uniref:Uncharacterized protein n=1 Tax=Chitinophaga qingshengii TaxID=1569794 RepID=A0ABR7TTJ9_9BACT|nr:hypothetical protein [Chitinophaga qingshengii]MBC9933786.1 hypothetical protein [Chitinophaga qingshengii]